MWRYKFTDKNIDKAIKFLKTEKGKSPPFIKAAFEPKVKDGKLFLKDKEVLLPSKIEKTLETLVKSGKVPLTRDSLYAALQRDYVNIRRSTVDDFLRSQSWITDTANKKPKKTLSWRVKKFGEIEYDTVVVKWKDLGYKPSDSEQCWYNEKKTLPWDDDVYGDVDIHKNREAMGHFFTAVDSFSGLTYIRYTTAISQPHVTPIAKHAFRWFAKQFKLKLNQLVGISDHGSEFDFELFKKWGIKIRLVPRGGRIEQKNSHIQRVLYRLAKVHKGMKIHSLVKLVQDNINNSPRKDGDTPMDLVGGKVKKKAKGKKSKITRPTINVGDRVRVMKYGIRKKEMYKAYKGEQWGKTVYTVKKKHGTTYYTLSDGKKHHISDLNKVGHDTVAETEKDPSLKPKPKPKKEAKKKFKSIDVSEANIVKRPRRKKKVDYSKFY